MQSHLTRSVFRAILNNEPLSFSQCRSRLVSTVPYYRARRLGPRSAHHVQRRGLFAFNMPPPSSGESAAQASPLSPEVGLKPMRDLARSLADRSRPPANDILAKAFRDFFTARSGTPTVITDFHARLLVVTWKHLKAQQDELEPDDWQAVFSTESLENVLFVLSEANCLPESHSTVLKVARFAFLELCGDRGSDPNEISRQALIAYITLLSLHGNPEEARHVVEKFWGKLHKSKPSPWLTVMRGFAMKGDRRQLRRITEELEKQGRKFDQASHQELTLLLIEQGLMDAVKTMYECPISDNLEPSLATKEAVIKFAILKSEVDWARPIFESLPQTPSPETRNIRLLWEAAHGSGAADLSEKLKAWTAEDPDMQTSLTISCVNSLVEFANSIRNPQLAADFAALASQWSLQPDLQTRMLQLEARIQACDLDGVMECLRSLEDIGSVAEVNPPLMNKLITMLCLSGKADTLFDQISALLDPLVENNVRLEADTVAALTHMLLYRHDWDAVSELLRPRLGSYDTEERSRIRKSLVTFIMDVNQETDHVWEAYNLLKVAFPETGVSTRTDIMTAFFKRNRSDLACLVFGHMRQSEDLSRRPKPDTYARCFQGLARAADKKNLELVHNMLKLDLQVDLNTRILNGLMLAYAACGMPEKSMEIFRSILRSEEGPSHKTIAIFFRVCESHHNGVQEALKMMDKVKRLEIEIDRRMYTAYIEALAAQCEFERAAEAVEKMECETGYSPTRNTYGYPIFHIIYIYMYT